MFLKVGWGYLKTFAFEHQSPLTMTLPSALVHSPSLSLTCGHTLPPDKCLPFYPPTVLSWNFVTFSRFLLPCRRGSCTSLLGLCWWELKVHWRQSRPLSSENRKGSKSTPLKCNVADSSFTHQYVLFTLPLKYASASITCLFATISALPRFLRFCFYFSPLHSFFKDKVIILLPPPTEPLQQPPHCTVDKSQAFFLLSKPIYLSPQPSLSLFLLLFSCNPPSSDTEDVCFLHVPRLSKLCSFPLEARFFLCLSGDFSFSCLFVLSGFSLKAMLWGLQITAPCKKSPSILDHTVCSCFFTQAFVLCVCVSGDRYGCMFLRT